jgi:Holliday junction resolvasome RuvABC endonuclease subunit
MVKKPLTILGINPGSKYLGIAVFQESDLRYWAIKVLKGVWSKGKIKKAKAILSDLIDRYDVNVLAIKKLHPSRSSKNLDRLATIIKEFSKRKGLKVYQYSLKDVKDFFSLGTKINKRQMAELIVTQYPFLGHPFEKEKRNRNPYFIRMFEAIALGFVCFRQLDH